MTRGENSMFQKQKETILFLLKSTYEKKKYADNYLIPYRDFFDATDDFTEFSCERLEGKQKYISLINHLLNVDENAHVFVEVYGFEEDNKDKWIYADTLIIFSNLPLSCMQQIFSKADNIFPSEIGELTGCFNENYRIIDKGGNLYPAVNLSNKCHSIYYCWWD